MNIQTVADNLRKTIADKVKHEVELEYALSLATSGERMALTATLAYLQINIDELKRILQDVEQCVYIDRYHEGYDAGWEQAILKERG
jgi:hypothetical protein